MPFKSERQRKWYYAELGRKYTRLSETRSSERKRKIRKEIRQHKKIKH